MAKIFEVFTDLPFPTQQEATRIQAKASGVRTTAEADFLTSLAPYLVNAVLLKVNGLIYIATGTTVHATVTATTNTDTTQVVEAKTKGTAGNALATTETLTNGSWGSTTLAGGVNGTVGLAKQVLADSSYLYIAIAANTIADANWRRVSLGSAF